MAAVSQNPNSTDVQKGGNRNAAKDDRDDIVLNDTKSLRGEIAKIGRANKKLKQDRDVINADIQANLDRLVSKGISKEALKRAIKDIGWDETQIENLDLAYQICRAALGKPIQQSLLPGTVTH